MHVIFIGPRRAEAWRGDGQTRAGRCKSGYAAAYPSSSARKASDAAERMLLLDEGCNSGGLAVLTGR